MSITAKELSQKLGISATAVSMALNNKPGVSRETRKVIIEAAEKYGYDFSKLSLKAKPDGEIYVIFYISNNAILSYSPIFDEMTDALGRQIKHEHYCMKILYFYEKMDDINTFIGNIRVSNCIGLIIFGTELTEYAAKQFLSLSLPAIILDSYFTCLDCNYILINNYQGAYMATEYLITHCRKEPGILKSSYPLYNFKERELGFRDAVKSNGMSPSHSIVHYLTPSIEGAYADMLEILEHRLPLADCYFADNDLIAIGAMKALKSKGYRIPEDIALIGFDDISECRIVEPALSTINVSRIHMAELAVRTLLESLNTPVHHAHKIQVSTKLIERSSI